jgi:hypothetical protein
MSGRKGAKGAADDAEDRRGEVWSYGYGSKPFRVFAMERADRGGRFARTSPHPGRR